MTEPKPCPFCGNDKKELLFCSGEDDDIVICLNCLAENMRLNYWNSRPIEDALRERIVDLESRLDLGTGNMYDVVVAENERLTHRIAELEQAQRWIPVEERLPEDDGTLNPEDCCFVFDGNSNEISRCSFVCRFLFDEMEMKNIVIYNFIEQQWELWFDNEMIDIQVTHWLTLPDGSK